MTSRDVPASRRFHIAGLELELDARALSPTLARLAGLYDTLDARIADYAASPANPHLCHAGCSACCKSSAFFALTLAEAVLWAQGIAQLAASARAAARATAAAHLATQHGIAGFARAGERDERAFTAAIAALCRDHHPPCPLLAADLCSTYRSRPLLCRAYGVPTDAYAVASGDALVFRSLCRLYEGAALSDYVRARDLRDELATLSRALVVDHRDVGRFTSAEAILAELC